jgi:hypothetical protein
MQIGGAGYVRRDPRYRYPEVKRVRVEAGGQGDGGGAASEAYSELEGTVEDISLSGIALRSAADVGTDSFVRLHIDGMEPVAGSVVRAYNGVIAVQFEKDEVQRQRVAHEVERLNRVA